jgi:hypothetical protein
VNALISTSAEVVTRVQARALERLLMALVDQQQARVLVPANKPAAGYWFGGGNLIESKDGRLYLCGRYRNFGDSRTGLATGERGVECAIFVSDDRGQVFEKALGLSKADLSQPGREVVSIEGSSLHWRSDGTLEWFISTEKDLSYPEAWADYQKPGTGVWSIDRLSGQSPESLNVTSLESVLENRTLPEYLHVKDPVAFDTPEGDTALIFCSHPFTWSSLNTGLALRPAGNPQFSVLDWQVVGRGSVWDVAATRITGRLRIPNVGVFAGSEPCWVYFYDGAECLRKLEQNPAARQRPRGYSCEELGGAFVGAALPSRNAQRLSPLSPLFTSPFGTGSSRYLSTLVLDEGILAVWQQSQPDESQPLLGHFLPMEAVERLLQMDE